MQEAIAKAADEYIAATGIPHSGGYLEAAFEAGVKWANSTASFEKIPIDAMEAAQRVFDDIEHACHMYAPDDVLSAIARAILSERLKCAFLQESKPYGYVFGGCTFLQSGSLLATDYVKANSIEVFTKPSVDVMKNYEEIMAKQSIRVSQPDF